MSITTLQKTIERVQHPGNTEGCAFIQKIAKKGIFTTLKDYFSQEDTLPHMTLDEANFAARFTGHDASLSDAGALQGMVIIKDNSEYIEFENATYYKDFWVGGNSIYPNDPQSPIYYPGAVYLADKNGEYSRTFIYFEDLQRKIYEATGDTRFQNPIRLRMDWHPAHVHTGLLLINYLIEHEEIDIDFHMDSFFNEERGYIVRYNVLKGGYEWKDKKVLRQLLNTNVYNVFPASAVKENTRYKPEKLQQVVSYPGQITDNTVNDIMYLLLTDRAGRLNINIARETLDILSASGVSRSIASRLGEKIKNSNHYRNALEIDRIYSQYYRDAYHTLGKLNETIQIDFLKYMYYYSPEVFEVGTPYVVNEVSYIQKIGYNAYFMVVRTQSGDDGYDTVPETTYEPIIINLTTRKKYELSGGTNVDMSVFEKQNALLEATYLHDIKYGEMMEDPYDPGMFVQVSTDIDNGYTVTLPGANNQQYVFDKISNRSENKTLQSKIESYAFLEREEND